MCLIKTVIEVVVYQKVCPMCLVKTMVEIDVDNKMTKKNM